jgi:hypothetical protein
MASELQKTGITPVVLRISAFYAAMGVGTYAPKGYSWFDRVEVKLEHPWVAADDPLESTQVIRVSFYTGSERQRYVEFMYRFAGFGGKHLLRLISDESKPLPRDP